MRRSDGQFTNNSPIDNVSRHSRVLGVCTLLLGCVLSISMFNGRVSAASDVDLVVSPAPSLVQHIGNAKVKPRDVRDIVVEARRGASLNVEAMVNNGGATASGPFEVRIYLANRSDGSGLVHEFDVVTPLSLPGKGQVLVTGEYVMPTYPVVAGRSYWLVFEADSANDVAERDEANNRRVISTVSVPCDELQKEDYVSEYLCPKFGEND